MKTEPRHSPLGAKQGPGGGRGSGQGWGLDADGEREPGGPGSCGMASRLEPINSQWVAFVNASGRKRVQAEYPSTASPVPAAQTSLLTHKLMRPQFQP